MDDHAPREGPVAEAVAWNALAYLLAGPLTYGGLGWLIDRWLGTAPVFAVLGALGGMILGLYIIWYRYGSYDRRPPAASTDAGHD